MKEELIKKQLKEKINEPLDKYEIE